MTQSTNENAMFMASVPSMGTQTDAVVAPWNAPVPVTPDFPVTPVAGSTEESTYDPTHMMVSFEKAEQVGPTDLPDIAFDLFFTIYYSGPADPSAQEEVASPSPMRVSKRILINKERLERTAIEQNANVPVTVVELKDTGEKEKDRASERPMEAYGVKGMKSTPWRKSFKNQAAYVKWLDKNKGNVEVRGTRNLDEAKSKPKTVVEGKIAKRMRELAGIPHAENFV